jgi:hypothetical protein
LEEITPKVNADKSYSHDEVIRRLGNPTIIRPYGHNFPPERYIMEALAHIVAQDYAGQLFRESERMIAGGASGAAQYFEFIVNGTGDTNPYRMTLFLAAGNGNGGKAMGTLKYTPGEAAGIEEIVRFEAVPRN